MAGAILFAALAFVRSWFGNQPWEIAAGSAFGVGVIAGLGAGRLVAARIAFHSFDGLLAADAVQPALARRYMVAWHGIAITAMVAVTLIARPSLLVVSVPAYLAGVFAAGVTARLSVRRIAGKAAVESIVRRWLHRPRAGIVAATLLLLSLLPAYGLETRGRLALVGMEAVLFTVVLTTVEQDIVRFKASSGHAPWHIVINHSYPLLLFAGVTAPVCWLVLGPAPAGIVLAASAAMLLLMAMRILAYCAHSKRFADFLVTIFAALLMLVAYSMTILLPAVAAAVLWQLQRRAAAKTWLLA